MNTDIQTYNNKQTTEDKEICDLLFMKINNELTKAESKIWHSYLVWFLDGNLTVGYNK